MKSITLILLALVVGAALWAACARQAVEREPAATPPPSTHEQGVFHHDRGYQRLKEADYDGAVADMDKARKLIDPQLVQPYIGTMRDVYFQSGIAYYDTGLYDKATILFDKAIDVAPSPSEYSDAYYQRGLSQHRKGNYPRAIADYDESIRLEPNNASAYELRAQAYERIGDSANAAQDWKKAKELRGE